MAKAAALIRNVNIPNVGWRRGTIIKAKNGKYKPNAIWYDGKEFEVEGGVYQVRHYLGGLAKYVSVGNDLETAFDLFEKFQASRQLESAEKKLGIKQPMPEEKQKTLAELVAAFVEAKKSPSQGLTYASKHLYEATLTAFAKHTKKEFVKEVAEKDVTGFIDHLIEEGYAPATCAMKYGVLRGFLASCGVDPSKLINLQTHKNLKKKPQPNRKPFTESQLEKLFAACPEYYKMVFTLLLNTGMRFREASHLTWENINWDEEKIFVPGYQHITNRGVVKEFKSKNRTGRDIPMYPTLKKALEAWREKNPTSIYVVGSPRGDQPNNHWLEYGKQFWREAKLECGGCKGCAKNHQKVAGRLQGGCDSFYLHRFRHTYAHRCLDAGIDIYELSQNMGHHDISVTIVYLKGRKSNRKVDPFAVTDANAA